MVYDLLIRGGILVDPAQGTYGRRDVALHRGAVVAVAERIAPEPGQRVVDATGKVVTPGLVDLHAHVFWGVSHYGIEPDRHCLAKGATTVVDAGSAGASTFPGFRRYVIDVAATRILAFLNISLTGMIDDDIGELEDLRHADVKKAVQAIERHRDLILGIKVRLSDYIVGGNDLEPLKRARQAADAVGLPVYVHIGSTPSPLLEILAYLRRGDIVTHCFHGHRHGILDEDGRVLPEVRRAAEEGVNFDVGHGRGSFAWPVAQKAVAQGFLPGTISSDLHVYNVHGPVFDLATTMSKFMALGVELPEVVRLATAAPAAAIKMQDQVGTLKEGAAADMAIFELQEGEFAFVDAHGQAMSGHQRLVPQMVVKGGRIYANTSIWVQSEQG